MKQKFKSYNFWLSLTSVAILFIRLIGARFGFTINENEFMDIMVVLCTIFVVLGIFEVPKTSTTISKSQEGVTMIDESLLNVMDISKQIKEDMAANLNKLDGEVQAETTTNDTFENNPEKVCENVINNVEDGVEIVIKNISNEQESTTIVNKVYNDETVPTNVCNVSQIENVSNIENVQNVAQNNENIAKIETNVDIIEDTGINGVGFDDVKNKTFQSENIIQMVAVDSDNDVNSVVETNTGNDENFVKLSGNLELQLENKIIEENDADSMPKGEFENVHNVEEINSLSVTKAMDTNETDSKKVTNVFYDYTLTEEDVENILNDYEKHVALGDIACSEDYIIMLQERIKSSHEKDFIN